MHMKKLIALMILILVFSSCKKLEDLNKNTKNPLYVTGESLFTGAQVNLFQEMVSPNVWYNIWRLIMQQWTETTYTTESNYFLAGEPDNHWIWMYQYVLKDLDQAKKNITQTVYLNDPDTAVKRNRLAIVEVMTVYTWSILVETYGNIPYSEALNINNLLPKYDDGLTIYKDLINRLSVAISQMDPNPAFGSMGSADLIYSGDVASWLKFANSLKLRMGMLLSDVDPVFAKTAVAEAASSPGGLISSNDENVKLVYMSSPPNTNPIYDYIVASGRHDFVPANTLVDTMNLLNDPRRPFYFTEIDTSTTPGIIKLAYVGGVNGATNDFTKFSHIADRIQEPTFEGLIFDYAETELLLAEGAERGYNVGGTAEEHYKKGVKASITYWGGSEADAETYLGDPRVGYSTAPGDFKRKIGFQMWIALYNRGFEAWTEYRKFDYPVLEPPPTKLADFPIRFTYPIEEQTLNGASYAAASAAIGGDLVTTKLFWDKH